MTCAHEREVLQAIRAGEAFTPDLQRHLEGCAQCSESLRIARALSLTPAGITIEKGDARILWLLAAERRYAAKERKLQRIMRMVPAFAILLVIAVTITRVFIWGGSLIDGLLGASGRIGPAFLVSAVFVVILVWTSPVHGRSS
jgi:hypothetical protein